MTMFYEGRINCFSPKSYMEKYNLTIIRPMVYIDEYMIKKAVKDYNYPIIVNPCPADGHTKRQDVKELTEVLFERKGLRWYSAESGEAGQGTAKGTERSPFAAMR